MNNIKINRAQKINRFLPMQETDVWALIPQELIAGLTAKQLSMVAAAINQSYHIGRGSCGAEEVDSGENCGAVFVNKLGKIIDWQVTGERPQGMDQVKKRPLLPAAFIHIPDNILQSPEDLRPLTICPKSCFNPQSGKALTILLSE
ncbi:MAG: hypothetical protein LBH43_18130 [Treponema sp.]|jgi:hypothetical protein|nr:hypothetical protein [Treponema sp.]